MVDWTATVNGGLEKRLLGEVSGKLTSGNGLSWVGESHSHSGHVALFSVPVGR